MDRDAARRAITELVEGTRGSGARAVLSACSSCFTCNTVCPTTADPYFLILERWDELYRGRGAPAIYRFVCPNQKDNIWTNLSILATGEERALFGRWRDNMDRPGKRPLVLGNYGHLFPHIVDSPLFDDFTIIDPIGHWECGAYLTQAGYLGEVEKIARAVHGPLNAYGDREIVVLTDAVRLLLNRFIPEQFGLSFSPRFSSFTRWLRDSLDSGAIRPKQKVDLRLAVHDSCYAKAEGAPLFDAAREVLAHTGARLVELAHNREASYCCGFGRGAADIPKHAVPFEIMKGAIRKIREAEAVGADGLVTYCTGCMYLLWAARELSGTKVAVYHLVEPVTMALGAYRYADLARQRERAWDIIALITLAYAKSFVQRRFFIGDPADVRYRPDEIPRGIAVKVLRRLFSLTPARAAYAAGFRAALRLLT
jgi:Fe-S oxidoreductase